MTVASRVAATRRRRAILVARYERHVAFAGSIASDGLGDVVLAASPVLGQSPSLDRSGFSEGWRIRGLVSQRRDALGAIREQHETHTEARARQEEVGLSTEDSLASLEAWRRSDDYAHLIADDVERVDILEQWRRRRRLEAATKGADASHAARAAAAVAALDVGSDLDREAIEKIAAAAAAKVSVEEAEAAMLRAEAESDAAAETRHGAGAERPRRLSARVLSARRLRSAEKTPPRWRLRARSLRAAATKPRRAPQGERPGVARVRRRRGGPRHGRP